MDKGTLSVLNQKMSGFLTNLAERGLWTGEAGENVLLATQNMIKADKMIVHGMGPKAGFSDEILKQEILDLGSRLDKIGVSEFGISIPVVEGLEKRYGSYLELSVTDLVRVFYESHKEESDFLLKMIFSVEGLFEGVLESVVKNVRNRFQSMLECSIIIDGKGRYKESETEITH